jgi:hypothetical protein
MFIVYVLTIFLMIDISISQSCLPINGIGCQTGSNCCFVPGRDVICEGPNSEGPSRCVPTKGLAICLNNGNTGCFFFYDCCKMKDSCPKCTEGKCGNDPGECPGMSPSSPTTCQIPPCETVDPRVKAPSIPSTNTDVLSPTTTNALLPTALGNITAQTVPIVSVSESVKSYNSKTWLVIFANVFLSRYY